MGRLLLFTGRECLCTVSDVQYQIQYQADGERRAQG